MARFKIEGGKPLKGSITPQGAKNEALQVICATLLTSEPVTIHNIPDILDVRCLIDLMHSLAVKVERLAKGTYRFTANGLNTSSFDITKFNKYSNKFRGSIMLVGPLLARFGKVKVPKPGGDKIGRRRLDTHFISMSKLGATFSYDTISKTYLVEANKIKGNYILLEEASVTGTANIIMAASLAQGTTNIYNAACEPYVQQLCKMLVRMGAKIEGIGSNLLTIHGVSALQGTEHTLLPDMIEVGSFIGLAAITMADLTIKDVSPAYLGIIPQVFRKLGIQLEIGENYIKIPTQEHYEIKKYIDGSILTISDAIWPGFSPDLLSIVLVTAIQARGTVLIHQRMFESRLFFVDKLIDMGAQIVLCDPHRANVIGLDRKYPLRGIQMSSPDIRAGIALLIAALSAEGTSIIENIKQIDRGYEAIDSRLIALGASIERID
ncbi:MAG: UDP-N-acetylglucosamine 1-carboxyvinyltransferase [Cytophagales bacterium]|nr:UDP-N-acetylglucosamine 1-carboxyvinyltransferase [Cytophagales bacterium]